MKPYRKTFRICKAHSAKSCGICGERVGDSPKAIRQAANKEINESELCREDEAQSDFNEDADFNDFCDNY